MDTETEVIVGWKDFGGSLPVDNVQDLASNNSNHVPPRYLRPELKFDQVSGDQSLQIPVIDMSKALCHKDQELENLDSACRNWGFFQLINHGVSEEVIERMKIETEEFFKLPLEEKMSCAQLPMSIEGYGHAFVVSEEQKLDWGDMLFLLPQPLKQREMRFWPNNASFRASLDKYSCELQRVAIRLLKMMAKNLGVDSERVASVFEDGTQGMRMNYYPPCVEANKVMGLAPHSDATGLTLLIQVNEVEGLQIKKYGKWLPIKPLPGAFVVNIGDIIEIMSNGEYKSIEHRAIVNQEKERLSIAAFHNPNMKAIISPLRDLVKDKCPNYKTKTHPEFLKLVVSSKLDGKRLLDRLKYRHGE